MKNKTLWFFNALLALIAIYIAYRIWFAPRNDAWNFIPDNAFIIVESSNIQQKIFDNKNPEANQLSDIPFFYDAVEQLRSIMQIVDSQSVAKSFLTKKRITYSLHRETKKNLEYIIYIPAGNFGDNDFLNKLILPNQDKYKIYARTYKGKKLYELFETSGKSLFNYFIEDDFLISSTSKILLEDVVNRMKSGVAIERVPFNESRKGSAHIYFKSRSLRDIADILPSQLSPNLIEFLGNITPRNPDIIFEKAKSPNTISAYFHSAGSSNVPFLGVFGKQIPKPMTSADMIPENTAIFLRLSFHHARLGRDLNNYMKTNNPSLMADKDSVNRLLNANLNSIYGILKDEIILCELETQADEPSKKILLLKTNEIEEALNLFGDFANKSENLSSYFKVAPFTHLNFQVMKMEISQLPAMLFGSTFQGFSDCYYTQKDDYIIMASDDEAMKTYLDALVNGQTWSKSTIYTDFLKKLRSEAQVTAIVSPQRIWNNLYFSLPQKWKNSIAKHEQRAKDIRFFAFESFVRNASFGTKILIEKQPKEKNKFTNKLFLQDSLSLSAPINWHPFLVKNPSNRADEIIVQQADNQVVLINNQAKIISSESYQNKLESNFYLNTDFVRDGLIDFTAITNENLVNFSRDFQKGLVISEPQFPIREGISSFAANQVKIYVADNTGAVFMLEEETGKISQIKTPSGLKNIVKIQPVKYKNNDYLAVLQKDGTLSVHYESGAVLKGFPKVPLSARPVDMIAELGNDQNSIISVISEVGEIKKVNMNGTVIESIQIEKTEKTTKFDVIFDQNQNDWLIARRTPTDLILFDKRGNSLLEIGNTNFFASQIRYFDLGNDLRILAIFDEKTNTFFDLKGNTIGHKPLPASALPAISYNETYNKLFIYNPNYSKFEVWTVKVK